MKKLLTLSIFLMLLFVPDARADRIVINGDTIRFWENSPLKQHPQFSVLLNKLEGFGSEPCFDCRMQGYDAEWTVINAQLYLTNIYSEYGAKTKLKADINKLFGVNNGRVKADWVTQKLWIPIGEGVGYMDIMTRLYEAEILLTFVDGRLITTKRFDYPDNKAAANRKRLDSIPEYLLSNVKWNKIKGMLKSGKRTTIGFTTSPTGKPVDIRFYSNSPDEKSKEEIIRLISSMPFPGPFIRGEFRSSSFTLPLKFTEADRKKYAR